MLLVSLYLNSLDKISRHQLLLTLSNTIVQDVAVDIHKFRWNTCKKTSSVPFLFVFWFSDHTLVTKAFRDKPSLLRRECCD